MVGKTIRLKVTSVPGPDGFCRRQDVRITNAETGQLVGGVQSCKVEFHLDKPHEMTITVIDFDFDIEGNTKVVRHNPPEKPSWWRRLLAWWSY